MLAATLHAAAHADAPARASLEDFARITRAVHAPALVEPAPGRVAVCRFWDTALRAARGPLAAPLAQLGSSLAWTQNPNYRRDPPDAAFLDNYGYAVIAGPPDGPPALVSEARVALGVLLLGPRTHYPLHAHPAVEVYVTLADGDWWRADGPWHREAAGISGLASAPIWMPAAVNAPQSRIAPGGGALPSFTTTPWPTGLFAPQSTGPGPSTSQPEARSASAIPPANRWPSASPWTNATTTRALGLPESAPTIFSRCAGVTCLASGRGWTAPGGRAASMARRMDASRSAVVRSIRPRY